MEPGDVIADRFTLELLAAQGGMGRVFRARDKLNGDRVAVKVVETADGIVDWRFQREVELLAKLKHAGIVRYVAHGDADQGHRYLAMEWLEGEDLAARLERGPLALGEAVLLVYHVAQALAFAHAQGLVHRDIKPSNVFLPGGQMDQAKLLDFGIARPLVRARAVTVTGMHVGTPAYMSPEQARGETTLDARSDVFSLGCVLFECLTGRRPFLGSEPIVVLVKIILEEAPRLGATQKGVPPALDALVARMLAKEAKSRPADGGVVAEELSALGALGTGSTRPLAPKRAQLTSGEQRLVSIVLVGSTGSPATQTQAQTQAQTQPETTALQHCVLTHSGRLEFLAEGSLVITFSGAGAATDQAISAARCALAVRSVLPERAIVVATGRGVHAAEHLVGEAVERAVAVLRHTALGEVRIDDVTASLVRAEFDVRADAQGYALRAERGGLLASRTVLGKTTPFMGRESELAALHGIFSASVEESTARGALVIAAAGLGKSRLGHEFVERLRARPSPVEILISRGEPLRAQAAFAMIGPLVRQAAGIVDGEPVAVRQAKLRAHVSEHVPQAEAIRVGEFLGELAGVSLRQDRGAAGLRLDAIALGDQMRRAWEDWLGALCAKRPVLMVLEDLHHADLPSIEYLEAALRNPFGQPLMVLALARPEIHEVFPALWKGRGVTEIALAPLSTKVVERLVRHVLPEASHDWVARVCDVAAGNAFFLEEILRVGKEGPTPNIPGSVLAMVQARLQQLPAEARRLLRAASMFGDSFWRDGVRQLLGDVAAARDVDKWLAELVQHELVARRWESRFSGTEEYAFRHAIVREAAYSLLTEGDAKTGHELAGDWLEHAGESQASVLAQHFERGGRHDRAVGWYRRAAAQALAGSDFGGAIAAGVAGRNCGAQGEALGALLVCEAEAHLWRGENTEAERQGSEALRLLPQGHALWCEAATKTVVAAGCLGHEAVLAEMLSQLEQVPWDATVAGQRLILTAALASHTLGCGLYDLSDRCFRALDDLGSGMTELAPAAVGRIEHARAIRANFAGDVETYLQCSTNAAEAFLRASDFRGGCVQKTNMGSAYLQLGLFEQTQSVLEEAMAVAERMGLAYVLAVARTHWAMAGFYRGSKEAPKYLQDTREMFRSQENHRWEGEVLGLLALVALADNDGETAYEYASAAATRLSDSPPYRVYALALLARAELERGQVVEASHHMEEAMALLKTLGRTEAGESLVLLSHALVLHAAGNAPEATRAISVARERLLERADRITNTDWRRAFCECVPENARILQLASAWAVGPTPAP